MSDISGNWTRFRTLRKKKVKRYGRSLLDKQAAFLYRQSLIGDQAIFDKTIFPWIATIESGWSAVRAELETVLERREELPSFHELSRSQKRISVGDNWKTFAFYVFGDCFEPNCRRCPQTAALLRQVPHLRNAWFSILSPHYRIPPHRGPTNGIVRVHLGLKIPHHAENCWIRVDDKRLTWKEGECIVFDDFYEHEVHNDTDEERVVLFFDVDRPLRPIGTLVNRALIYGMKQTSYVKDAMKNLQRRERQ